MARISRIPYVLVKRKFNGWTFCLCNDERSFLEGSFILWTILPDFDLNNNNNHHHNNNKNKNKNIEFQKCEHVRSGIRTHAYKSRLRPERSALDRSAILTTCFQIIDLVFLKKLFSNQLRLQE